LGECLLWDVFKLKEDAHIFWAIFAAVKVVHIHFEKLGFGLQFGRFFQKQVWSLW
jgi:hypothetical protein